MRLAQTTDDRAVAIRRYRQGDRPEAIADDLEADLETVTAALRRATDLPPWDDHRALAGLYDHHGSCVAIADALEGARSSEVIRVRTNKLGVDREQTNTERLEDLNPEDVGLSPLRDDEFPTPDEDDQQTLDAFGGGSA